MSNILVLHKCLFLKQRHQQLILLLQQLILLSKKRIMCEIMDLLAINICTIKIGSTLIYVRRFMSQAHVFKSWWRISIYHQTLRGLTAFIGTACLSLSFRTKRSLLNNFWSCMFQYRLTRFVDWVCFDIYWSQVTEWRNFIIDVTMNNLILTLLRRRIEKL